MLFRSHVGADKQSVRLAKLMEQNKLDHAVIALYSMGLPYAWEQVSKELDRIENKKLKKEVGKLFGAGDEK